MLKAYYDKYPRIIKPVLEELDEALKLKLSSVLLDPNFVDLGAGASQLDIHTTSNAQPAILACSYAVLEVLRELSGQRQHHDLVNNTFKFTLGHSLGEYTALTAAGVIEFYSVLQLVRARGLAMEKSKQVFLESLGLANEPELGMYTLILSGVKQDLLDRHEVASASDLVVKLLGSEINKDALHPLAKYLQLALINSKNLVVFSGPKAAFDKVAAELKTKLEVKRAFKVIPLKVSAPFHSPVMTYAQEQVEDYLESQIKLNKVKLNWPVATSIIANATAMPFANLDSVKHSLVHSCTESVYWANSVNYAVTNGVTELVNFGPGNIGDNTKRDMDSSVTTTYLEPDTLGTFIATL
jgi:[acyl-carrier-protein] S-malonyltransferase